MRRLLEVLRSRWFPMLFSTICSSVRIIRMQQHGRRPDWFWTGGIRWKHGKLCSSVALVLWWIDWWYKAFERIEQEQNMLPQLTYEEVDDYFNVLQAPTLTSDIADDVLSLPSPPPLHLSPTMLWWRHQRQQWQQQHTQQWRVRKFWRIDWPGTRDSRMDRESK